MHASMIGKRMFEKISNKDCEVFIASEFAYDLLNYQKSHTLF